MGLRLRQASDDALTWTLTLVPGRNVALVAATAPAALAAALSTLLGYKVGAVRRLGSASTVAVTFVDCTEATVCALVPALLRVLVAEVPTSSLLIATASLRLAGVLRDVPSPRGVAPGFGLEPVVVPQWCFDAFLATAKAERGAALVRLRLSIPFKQNIADARAYLATGRLPRHGVTVPRDLREVADLMARHVYTHYAAWPSVSEEDLEEVTRRCVAEGARQGTFALRTAIALHALEPAPRRQRTATMWAEAWQLRAYLARELYPFQAPVMDPTSADLATKL